MKYPSWPGSWCVLAVAAGGAHSLALKSDHTVVAWGYNSAGQSLVPGGLSNVVAIAAGGDHSLALKSDGTVVAWGDNAYGESAVPPGLNNVIAISAGFSDSMALVLPALPTLQATLSGNDLLVSWPSHYAGFTLQFSSDPSSGNWSDYAYANPPSIVGGQYIVTNPISGGAGFFRLKK